MSKRKRNTRMAPVEVLHEELIEEILLRLPSKSLLRFKGVSKQWLALIASQSFALRHHPFAKAKNFASFFVLRMSRLYDEKGFITPLSVSLKHSVIVHQNLDLPLKAGRHVLVSAGLGIYCVIEKHYGTFRLWNPTTRECIALPWPCEYRFNPVLYFGKVDYKDGNFSYIVGQIIQRGELGGQKPFSIEFYSSKGNCRKIISDCFGEFLGYRYRGGVCINLNGKAHWLMRSGPSDINIATFDYETEAFGKIKVQLAPEGGRYYPFKATLSLWNDVFLCLVLCWENDYKLFLDVWVMHEYGVENSWSKKFTVGPISRNAEVLGFSSKIQGIFVRPRCSCPTSLKLYDCKSSNMIRFRLPSERKDHYLQIEEHAESLLSLSK